MINLTASGDWSKTTLFLERAKGLFTKNNMFDKYGQQGVDALRMATPRDTGKTAESWYYEIENSFNGTNIVWKNSNINKGVNIAIIIQYGHGTNRGAYVQGIDYINPALQSIFTNIADDIWKEVTK